MFTAEDGGPTTGPWVVHVLAVDPRHSQIEPVLANDVIVDRERLSELAARHGALAAINGGYFVIGAGDGTPGDLAGSSILDGRFVSEAVDGRTSLLLGRGRAAVSALSDRRWAQAPDGALLELDGENRRPGLIRACGGDGTDLPTALPLHDFTCTDPSELIHSTPILGAATETGPGTEAVLDGRGRVVALPDPRGAPSQPVAACSRAPARRLTGCAPMPGPARGSVSAPGSAASAASSRSSAGSTSSTAARACSGTGALT